MQQTENLTEKFDQAFNEFLPISEKQLLDSQNFLRKDILLFNKLQQSSKSDDIWRQIYDRRHSLPSDIFFTKRSEEINIIFWLLRAINEAKKVSDNSVNIETIERNIRELGTVNKAITDIVKLNPSEIESLFLPHLFIQTSGILGSVANRSSLTGDDFSEKSIEEYLKEMSHSVGNTIVSKQRMVEIIKTTVHTGRSKNSLPARAFAKYMYSYFEKTFGIGLKGTVANITNIVISPEKEIVREDIKEWMKKK